MTDAVSGKDGARAGDGPQPQEDLVERLLAQADAQDRGLVGPGGVLTELTQRVLESALNAEMSDHLGYEPGDRAGDGSGNSRNGRSAKTVLTDVGPVPITVPRDRNGTFEPQIVPKRARRLDGLNDAIISLYARGMTVRDIRAHLAELYGVEVSADLISTVTEKVAAEITEWQNRPLEARRILGIVANQALLLAGPLSHELVRGSVVEAEAGSVVELGGDVVELVGGPDAEVCAFREVLAEQAVGVLVGAALPG